MVVVVFLFFFFFKQKTAYEMRISDWSSDVCSSDLGRDVEGTARISAAPVRFQTHFHVGEFFRSEILNRGEHRRKSRGIEPTATIAASCGDVSEDVDRKSTRLNSSH